jgi:8-amino-7-oxononanoate synthase
MDIFKKCFDFTRADEVKKAGLYPYFHPIDENEGPVVSIYGKPFIMAGSNNYLGLTTHPLVKQKAKEAIDRYGTGCSGSRYLTGTLALHNELEDRLAKFLGVEAVLLFSTGYQTSLGIISSLVGRGEYVIMDKENHASLMNGAITAKGMMAEFKRYKHSDMEDLEKVLSSIPLDAGKLIVTDGVFSVTGEICNLVEINKLAKKYNARVLCDDAHATGVIGKGGRGTASCLNEVENTDLTMGTFSKSFASLGGFVAGKERVINYIKHICGAIIFSASPTPASCAATLAALDILEKEPELPERLISNSNYMRNGFRDLGFDIYESKTAIVPVIVGQADLAFQMWRKLFDRGIFVNAFIPPGVPENMSMMRTSYMVSHQKEHLDKILDAFALSGKELGILK